MAATHTVSDRIAQANQELTRWEVAAGLALTVGLLIGLLLLQQPLAHDGLHNFRHAAGVVCH
jgi:hypothetical protein